jgi:uncharacterized protein (TIGR03435 family)
MLRELGDQSAVEKCWNAKLTGEASGSPVLILALAIGLGPALGTCLAAPGPAFEVATVKLSPPLDETRRLLFDTVWETVGLASLPGPHNRVEIRNATLAQLIAMAYRIRPRMIVGPSWLSDSRFEVIATIPSGHARQEGPEMLQTLLQERFALRAHRDVRTMSGYVLSVRKGGPKLKETIPIDPTVDRNSLLDRPRPPLHGDNWWEFKRADMAHLADVLAQNVHAPVEDQTGLKGFYAITFRIAASDRPDDAEKAARFERSSEQTRAPSGRRQGRGPHCSRRQRLENANYQLTSSLRQSRQPQGV